MCIIFLSPNDKYAVIINIISDRYVSKFLSFLQTS